MQINKTKASIKSKCNNKDFIDISNIICKSKEKVFKITKSHQIKKFIYLQKQPKYRNTPVPDIIRKKWVINLSSKPLQWWRAITTTERPQVCCKFFQSSPHWVHCSYQKNLWWAQWEYCRKGLHRNLQENQWSLTTLQGKEVAHLQHHQRGMGGHQNPQERLLPCGSNSGQGSSPGSHG